MYARRFGKRRYIIPAAAPYAASSSAIHTAVGNKGGMPNVRERNSGAAKPTASPQGQPQIKPQSNTGRCIGHNMAPMDGICPVKNGMT